MEEDLIKDFPILNQINVRFGDHLKLILVGNQDVIILDILKNFQISTF